MFTEMSGKAPPWTPHIVSQSVLAVSPLQELSMQLQHQVDYVRCQAARDVQLQLSASVDRH